MRTTFFPTVHIVSTDIVSIDMEWEEVVKLCESPPNVTKELEIEIS
jgi:hypothetical protein